MKALIIVDVQKDFCKGGSLEVPDADSIVSLINNRIKDFDVIVVAQDFHPQDHGSFASNNPGTEVFAMGELSGNPQIMWPDHCVQNTRGAEFHEDLNCDFAKVIQKGVDKTIDSYSAFYDNNKKNKTGLTEFLKEMEVDEVSVAGLATEYCVKFTALDAVKEGFKTTVLANLSRGINQKDVDNAYDELLQADISIRFD